MHQALSIPTHRDPVARIALVACALALAWLAISSALPAASAKEEPQIVIVVATPTPPSSAPEAAPGLAAPTAAPADPVAVAPVDDAPASRVVQHADGSTSLPGSETWMAPQLAVTSADPSLEIARDAAAAYQQLPTAAAPSAENAQPNYSKRPHTGR